MRILLTRWSRSLAGLALLLGLAAVVWGAKPAPPPPPPPPAIKFNLKLFPTTESATELSMNEIIGMNNAAVAVGHFRPPGTTTVAYPRIYIGGTVWDANELITTAQRNSWLIIRAHDINNALQVAVRAEYQGAAEGGLVPGASYIGVLDINPASESVGTVTPILEVSLGGTVSGVSIRGMNDLGEVCGEFTAATTHAFVMGPGDTAPTFLFEEPWTPGAVYSQAHDVNEAGQVVGRRNAKGYRYTPGEPTLYFGMVETGKGVSDFGLGRSINSTGEFCGDAMGKAGWLPVAYADGAGLVKLSTSSGPAKGINDRKDVIYQITAAGSYVLLGVENVHVNLLTAGVVQGISTEVTRFRNSSPNLECLNESRVIAGNFSDSSIPAQVAFILTPAP